VTLSEIAIRRPVATILLAGGLVLAGCKGGATFRSRPLPTSSFRYSNLRVVAWRQPGPRCKFRRDVDRTAVWRRSPASTPSRRLRGRTDSRSPFSFRSTAISMRQRSTCSRCCLRCSGACARNAEPAKFSEVKPGRSPIIVIGVSSEAVGFPGCRRFWIRQIIPRIGTMNGVSQVNVFGQKKYAVRVRVRSAGAGRARVDAGRSEHGAGGRQFQHAGRYDGEGTICSADATGGLRMQRASATSWSRGETVNRCASRTSRRQKIPSKT